MSQDEQLDLFRKVFLEANPNPERIGCPGAEIFKTIARQPRPGTHPAEDHLGTCSPCFAEYLSFRQEWKRARRFRVLASAIVACLLIASCAGFYFFKHRGLHADTEMARTVDLSEKGTFRGDGGESSHLEAVSLPAARVRVLVILPKMSDPGVYAVSVSLDQTSRTVLAHGSARAQGDDKRRTVSVILDLRRTPAGSYFLATTHDQDEASYFYPLKVD